MKKILLTFLSLISLSAFAQIPVEGFEGNWPPAGWSVVNVAGPNQQWQQTASPVLPYQGSYSAMIAGEDVIDGTQSEDWLITPQFVVAGDSQLNFVSRLLQEGDQGNTYKVMIGTDPTNIGAFVELRQWTELELSPAQTEFHLIVVNIPQTYLGQSVHLAFVMKGDSNEGWIIDNVGVENNCVAPDNLSVFNVALTSADLAWTNQGTATAWEVEIVPEGVQPQGIGVPVTTVPYTVTGLSPGQCYEFYARAICSESSFSPWAGGISFCLGEITDYNITGTLRFDANADGICNAQDAILPNTPLQISGGGFNTPVTIYTNAQGEYSISNVNSGLITLQPVLTTEFEAFTAVPQQFTFSAGTTTIVNDICVPAPVTVQPDLSVALIPQGSPRPGFNITYLVMVTNNSATIFPGASVELQFTPERLSLVTTGSSIVAGNGTATMSFASPFLPYASQVFYLDFLAAQPPVNNAGDPLAFLATLTPHGVTDVVLLNNAYPLEQTFVNSYDPNNIIVSEGVFAPIEIIEYQQRYMHYTINFQNTGSAEAVNVRLTNTLDALFDAESFQPLASSHNYTVTRTGSELEFKFNGINLPYSGANEPGSHGFVSYRVKISEVAEPGDTVQGTANIYFDFNPAIVTNTAVTEFYTIVNTESNTKQQIKLYPNPVSELVNISITDGALQSVSVYDINGRLCLQSGNETAINLAQLTSGLYMVKVVTDTGMGNYKLIKK